MSLARFLSAMVQVLDEAGIRYMLTGSLAAAYYATPRATQDVDLIIEPTETQVRALVSALSASGLYVSAEAAQAAVQAGGQFNAIDPESGWKVDFLIRKNRPFSITEFSRRRDAELLGVEVSLTTLEDLIVAKLEWSELGDSELQRRDIAYLLEASWDRLDRDYIEDWANQLGLADAWKRMVARLQEHGEGEV